MIYISQDVFDELEMAPKVWCPSCRIMSPSVLSLESSNIEICRKCGVKCLDWNDVLKLEKEGKLEWITITGFMSNRPTLFQTEDGL